MIIASHISGDHLQSWFRSFQTAVCFLTEPASGDVCEIWHDSNCRLFSRGMWDPNNCFCLFLSRLNYEQRFWRQKFFLICFTFGGLKRACLALFPPGYTLACLPMKFNFMIFACLMEWTFIFMLTNAFFTFLKAMNRACFMSIFKLDYQH